MDKRLIRPLERMKQELLRSLNMPAALYLYGSAVLDDYRPGWSDIDILCLTEKELPLETAQRLTVLRQTMCGSLHDPIYRTFEGAILPQKAFLEGLPRTAVYWGTSGQRLQDGYTLDCFSRWELLTSGVLLCGTECRGQMALPTYEELRSGVAAHCQSIRRHGSETGESLYSCGWLLDIARCLYTLRTGAVTGKTQAGEWALQEGLCPVPLALERALKIRRDPRLFHEDPACRRWCGALGPDIQAFCDVLEHELKL